MENWKSDNRPDMWLPLASSDEAVNDGSGNIAVRQLSSGFNTSFMFSFEHYNEVEFYQWLMPSNWTLCLWSSAVYLAIIYMGRKIMEKRARFEIQTQLVLWNMMLAAFSICAAIRMNQELFHVITQHGWEYACCVSSYGQVPFGFWVVAFTLSKLVELGDTIFVVLRKQPLIFLHWYHHIATLIYTWVTYTERMSSGRWFITMNLSIHAIMYTYYTIRAMRIRIPRWINVCITTGQILQMVLGLIVNIAVIRFKQIGHPCNQSYFNITFGLVMYLSYFLLFTWYFYNAYIRPMYKARQNTSLKIAGNLPTSVVDNKGFANGTRTNGLKRRGANDNAFKNGTFIIESSKNGVKKDK